jgi:hypothetical protein
MSVPERKTNFQGSEVKKWTVTNFFHDREDGIEPPFCRLPPRTNRQQRK